MKFLKSRQGAALITAIVIVFSVIFGSGRSLNAVRSDIWTVYDQGVDGDGHSVRSDLEARRNVCHNLYKVAQTYLPASALNELSSLLGEADHGDMDAFHALDSAARPVIELLGTQPLSQQDANYVEGFRQELDSRAFSIANDPYTEMAQEFNRSLLSAFPANVLHSLLGVQPLPVYD